MTSLCWPISRTFHRPDRTSKQQHCPGDSACALSACLLRFSFFLFSLSSFSFLHVLFTKYQVYTLYVFSFSIRVIFFFSGVQVIRSVNILRSTRDMYVPDITRLQMMRDSTWYTTARQYRFPHALVLPFALFRTCMPHLFVLFHRDAILLQTVL